MQRYLLIGAATLVLGLPGAAAENGRVLNIQSKSDSFELRLNGNSGSVNGKTADLSVMRELLPLFNSPLSNDCPTFNEKPEATVKEDGKTRSFYLKAGVISDGKNCLTVSGDGLMYFPIHRDFLIGAKRDGLKIKSPIKVSRQGVKLFEIIQNGSAWTQKEESKLLLNWDFIERLLNSLQSFDVRFRAVADSSLGKVKITLQTGDQTYEFYKLSETTWAVKKPGQSWLIAADDWSFWYDFGEGVLEEPAAEQIRFAEDSSHSLTERLHALQLLNNGWSPNLRELYHRLVLDRKTEVEIKTLAMKRLKGKPARETALVMAQFLSITDDDDMKRSATQILKINDPKGPLFNPESSDEEKQKVIEFWRNWWAKNRISN